MSVEFVDELPPAGSRGDTQKNRELRAFADELRAHPNRWAKYPFQPLSRNAGHSKASQIRAGAIRTFPGGDFDATYRDGAVYVRFVGGEA